MYYSVVVPAHNEAKNLERLVVGLRRELKKTKKPFEIIVVNDNSTDNTVEVLKKLKKRVKQLRAIHRTKDKGVGNTIRQGLNKVKGNFIITLDGDLSHNPKELPRFLKAIKKCDMVCGSRYTKYGKADMNLSRLLISGLFNSIFRKIFGLPVKDFTSGYRIYKREVIDNTKYKSSGFGIYIEIPLKAHLLGYKLKEVPITYKRRSTGKSKLSYLKQGPDYLRVVFDIIKQKTI